MELRGHVVTRDRIINGALGFGAEIAWLKQDDGSSPQRYILPGFIDTHVHGGGGGDAMDGAEGIATLARFHLRHGTTSLLPTTITHPWADVMRALRDIAAARTAGISGGAAIIGAHLEGPFINPRRLGAQPPFTILPTVDRLEDALSLGVIRVVTLAAEMPEATAAILRFAGAGVRVSQGHSTADYATAAAAIAAVQAAGGVPGGTHLFNAMGGIEGRVPGLAGALLGSDHAFAELILDLHHVHPGAFRMALAAIGDRLLLITDAMRGAGMGDGESELGGRKVLIRDGAARLTDGSLAGSVLTMDAALRNAVAAGVPLVRAARLAATNAAAYLGLTDRGEIAEGKRADLVVLGAGLTVEEVWVAGERHV